MSEQPKIVLEPVYTYRLDLQLRLPASEIAKLVERAGPQLHRDPKRQDDFSVRIGPRPFHATVRSHTVAGEQLELSLQEIGEAWARLVSDGALHPGSPAALRRAQARLVIATACDRRRAMAGES